MHGQFVWYELTTPDPDASKRFYPRITGWGTQQFDKDYTMWTNASQPFAGIFRLSDEMRQQGVPPNWMPYIEADNVDEAARKAAAAGGKVVVPAQDIPGTGRFAVISDPQGAMFGLYKSNAASRAWDGTAKRGGFSWHELMTTDSQAAFDFYRRVFGWDKTSEMDMGPQGKYVMFGPPDRMYGGIYNRDANSKTAPRWLCYVNVPDVNAATAAITAGGGKVTSGPMEVPGGSMVAMAVDPQGAPFAVHQTASRAQRAEGTVSAKAVYTGTAKKAAKKTAKNAAKKAVRKAAKKTPRKTAKKATKRPAKKAGKKTASRTAKKAKKRR